MNTTQPQPKDYMTAREECWNAYLNDNHDMSEYMERDYKSGFSDGYNAAMNNVALRRRDDALRERAAIAAMDTMLRSDVTIRLNGEAVDFSPVNVAKAAVVFATALVNQLNTEQS